MAVPALLCLTGGLACADDGPASLPLAPGAAAHVIRVILGVVALLALAYLGGHPRVRALERRLRISQVVTAGLPFVVLGYLAHLPAVGVLPDPVLRELGPLLPIGLGWIGFAAGLRFDLRPLQEMSREDAVAALLHTAMAVATIVAIAGLAFVAFSEAPLRETPFLRDAMVLGAAGAMAGRQAPRFLALRGSDAGEVERARRIVLLEELAGIAGLMALGAFFRPPDAMAAWQLPGIAWLLVTLGLATTIALLAYAALSTAHSGPDFTVLLLGTLAFAAGMTSFLRLSPVVVCFLAGALVVNLPGRFQEPLREAIHRLERPVYLVFLTLAGALWRPEAWQGWVLLALFVSGRVLGRAVGRFTLRALAVPSPAPEAGGLVVAPISALAIAIVVSAQDLHFGASVPWMVTAVLGGAIVTEVLVQTARGEGPGAPSEEPTP